MKKKILTGLTALAVLLTSGCSAMFQKDYSSVEAYTEEEHNEYWRSTVEVTNYREFRDALSDMVKNHVEEERLHIVNYDGDLNTIRDDFFRANQEIQNETALGSYAVSHVSNDGIIQIVTHYEVTVHIGYKRTEEEIAALRYISSLTRLGNYLEESLGELRSYCAVRINSAELSAELVSEALSEAFYNNPASCIIEPEATVTLHPAEGLERIVEIEIGYKKSAGSIVSLRQELQQALEDMYGGIAAPDEQRFALEAYNALAAHVSYDPDGELRREAEGMDAALGGSAYGALVDGLADSHGIALAYSMLCREAGIECLVVRGAYDKIDHSWNLIRLGDQYYHVDVSADSALGITGAFGRSDVQMSGYWWVIEDYPEAEGSIEISDTYPQ